MLSASTATSYTVPGSSDQTYRAFFGCAYDSEIWVRLNGTAVVPLVDVSTNSPDQEFVVPGMARYVKGGDTLSFISTGTPSVGVSLLAIPR